VTIHDWLTLGVLVLFGAAIAWNVYQNLVMKKDVTLLSTLKEADDLWNAINHILSELEVDTVDKAIQEIGVLKGTVPTPADEVAAWEKNPTDQSPSLPVVPVVKK
jgi:hypothetical protein